MKVDFKSKSRVNRAHLADAYNDLFGDNISTDNIMMQLRVINKDRIFEPSNIKHSGSNHYIYPKGKKI